MESAKEYANDSFREMERLIKEYDLGLYKMENSFLKMELISKDILRRIREKEKEETA